MNKKLLLVLVIFFVEKLENIGCVGINYYLFNLLKSQNETELAKAKNELKKILSAHGLCYATFNDNQTIGCCLYVTRAGQGELTAAEKEYKGLILKSPEYAEIDKLSEHIQILRQQERLFNSLCYLKSNTSDID